MSRFLLRINNRSFRYASPYLWNQLPVSFPQPCIKHRADDVTYTLTLHHTLTVLFQAQNTFSTNLFHHASTQLEWTAFSDYTGPDIAYSAERFISFSYFFLGRAVN